MRSERHTFLHRTERGYVGFFEEDALFFIVLLPEATFEEGSKSIDLLGNYILEKKPQSLAALEETIANGIKAHNFPTHTSLALGHMVGDVLHLQTLGDGEIYIKRGTAQARIIGGNKNASGYPKSHDTYLFTTSDFPKHFPSDKLFHLESLKDTEDVTQQLVALSVTFSSSQLHIQSPQKEVPEQAQKPSPFSSALLRFQQMRTQNPKRSLTLIGVGIVIFILIWSVILGYQRRSRAQETKAIETSRELITQKLSEASDVAFLNVARSQVLIGEAKQELVSLKGKVDISHKKEVDALESLITAQEQKIMHKEDKQATEFYDLTLDHKGAVGVKLGVAEDSLLILDSKGGTIYTLSLAKKSLDKIESPQIRSATVVGGFEDLVYFIVPGDGVYGRNDKGVKKVIENDGDWGKITDIALYNGNIYALDTPKASIYKYLVTDAGFGQKSYYLKSAQALEEATSLTIDSSVYVSSGSKIYKYTGGAPEDFVPQFPGSSVQIDRVSTDKNTEHVYAWDKGNSVLYVLSKSGTYEQQVTSSVLKQADDVVTSGTSAYILVKEKIHTLDLR